MESSSQPSSRPVAGYLPWFTATVVKAYRGWTQLWVSPLELRLRNPLFPWEEVSRLRSHREVALGRRGFQGVSLEWTPHGSRPSNLVWVQADHADRVAWALDVSGWTGPFAMSDLIVPCTNRYWGRGGFLVLNRERVATEFFGGEAQSHPRVAGQSLTRRRRWRRSQVSLRMPGGDEVGLGVVSDTGPLGQAALATEWPLAEDPG